MKIDQSKVARNQKTINFTNASFAMDDLNSFLDRYGIDYIMQDDFSSEEECCVNYVVKARTIKLATEAIELYIKAILIHKGHRWDEAKSWGHNLLLLFNALDDESKNIILAALAPINEYYQFNGEFEEFTDFKFLFRLLHDFGELDDEELMGLPPMDGIIPYLKNVNSLKKEVVPLRHERIVPLKGEDTLEGVLGEAEAGSKQPLTVRARYPGQTLISTKRIELLISLAYALKGVADHYLLTDGLGTK